MNVGELHSSSEGNGRLFLYSANDKPTVSLATNTSNGGGIMTIRNADGNESIKAVSYTHLDVYKRQHQKESGDAGAGGEVGASTGSQVENDS